MTFKGFLWFKPPFPRGISGNAGMPMSLPPAETAATESLGPSRGNGFGGNRRNQNDSAGKVNYKHEITAASESLRGISLFWFNFLDFSPVHWKVSKMGTEEMDPDARDALLDLLHLRLRIL